MDTKRSLQAAGIVNRTLGNLRKQLAAEPMGTLRNLGFEVLEGAGSTTDARHVDLVVGPTGVFTVETASCTGRITVEAGNLGSRKDQLDGMLTEALTAARTVQQVLDLHPDAAGVATVPVISIRGASVHGGTPDRRIVRGVTVCSCKDLVRTVTSRRPVIDEDTVDEVAEMLAKRLPYTRAEGRARRNTA